jgi:hypothetical protein
MVSMNTTTIVRNHGITGAKLNFDIATDARILRLTPDNCVVAVTAKAAADLYKMFVAMGWHSVDCMGPKQAARLGW